MNLGKSKLGHVSCVRYLGIFTESTAKIEISHKFSYDLREI